MSPRGNYLISNVDLVTRNEWFVVRNLVWDMIYDGLIRFVGTACWRALEAGSRIAIEVTVDGLPIAGRIEMSRAANWESDVTVTLSNVLEIEMRCWLKLYNMVEVGFVRRDCRWMIAA